MGGEIAGTIDASRGLACLSTGWIKSGSEGDEAEERQLVLCMVAIEVDGQGENVEYGVSTVEDAPSSGSHA